jgi:hypothetical protein
MAHYGTEPVVAAVVWEMLVDDGWTKKRRRCKPKHLLFALKFKKCYDTEMSTASALGVDEKTYRKWVWFMIEGIARLKRHVVSIALLCSIDMQKIVSLVLTFDAIITTRSSCEIDSTKIVTKKH